MKKLKYIDNAGVQRVKYSETIKPKNYIVGDKVTDGHVHKLSLREDLPRATSSVQHHEHSIVLDGNGNLFCELSGTPEHRHIQIKKNI